MKYLEKKNHNVYNLFSNGQGDKGFIYRDKAKYIQMINLESMQVLTVLFFKI